MICFIASEIRLQKVEGQNQFSDSGGLLVESTTVFCGLGLCIPSTYHCTLQSNNLATAACIHTKLLMVNVGVQMKCIFKFEYIHYKSIIFFNILLTCNSMGIYKSSPLECLCIWLNTHRIGNSNISWYWWVPCKGTSICVD